MNNVITPPKGTTSTHYHNKAMEVRSTIASIDNQIQALQKTRQKERREFRSLISARNNSIRYGGGSVKDFDSASYSEI